MKSWKSISLALSSVALLAACSEQAPTSTPATSGTFSNEGQQRSAQAPNGPRKPPSAEEVAYREEVRSRQTAKFKEQAATLIKRGSMAAFKTRSELQVALQTKGKVLSSEHTFSQCARMDCYVVLESPKKEELSRGRPDVLIFTLDGKPIPGSSLSVHPMPLTSQGK